MRRVFEFFVAVDSPIDMGRIEWKPEVVYTAAEGVPVTDASGNYLIRIHAPWDADLYPDDGLTSPQDSWTAPSAGIVTVSPELAIGSGQGSFDSHLVFTVKRRSGLGRVIRRVSRLPRILRTTVELGAASVAAGRVATVAGRVVKTAAPGLSGVVRVEWQRLRSGRWRTGHKAIVRADRPFRAQQALARSGTWRVRATYVGKAPYRSSSSVAAVPPL